MSPGGGAGAAETQALGWRLRRWRCHGGPGKVSGEREAYVWGWRVRGGQKMQRPEMGRVIAGSEMRRDMEGPGSEADVRKVCRAGGRGRFWRWESHLRVWRAQRGPKRVLGPWQEVKIRGPKLGARQ